MLFTVGSVPVHLDMLPHTQHFKPIAISAPPYYIVVPIVITGVRCSAVVVRMFVNSLIPFVLSVRKDKWTRTVTD